MDHEIQNSHLYTSLIQAVTVSFSASDFCRHLVHSVFKDLDANGAMICKLALDSSLLEVGSYGVQPENLKAQLTTVFDETAIAKAIRKQQQIVAGDCAQVALPLQQDGLVAGGLLLTFTSDAGETRVPSFLLDSLQIAGATYLEKTRGGHNRNGSLSANPRADQTELSTRQAQILGYLNQPLTYAQIGKVLHVSESLVKQEAGKVFRFLGVDNRKDAVAVAQSREMLS